VKSLAAFDDLDIEVVTTKRGYVSLETEPWDRVTIHRLPWAGGGVLRNAVGPGRQQMQSYLHGLEPDMIHAHDTYGLMVKGMTLPRVFTIHGFIHGDVLVSGSRMAVPRAWIWRRIETAGWADQPHIISISPYVRERLRGIAWGVIHDIDNPVAEPFFQVERKERKGVIFSAAVVTPRKNVLALIEAAARLVGEGMDLQLRLAGSLDDDAYVQQVRNRIEHLNLRKQIVLLGRIDVEQIRKELSAASVFSLVSLEENSPMGIEEAMAASVPVITSNRCGMPYMVRDGESGFLVDPNNPTEIARCLRQLIENDSLRQSMGMKGREIALDRFHPAKVAARTREVYLRAIDDFHK
jgi:glycosyltransferase involved in cell wall biosynthesis